MSLIEMRPRLLPVTGPRRLETDAPDLDRLMLVSLLALMRLRNAKPMAQLGSAQKSCIAVALAALDRAMSSGGHADLHARHIKDHVGGAYYQAAVQVCRVRSFASEIRVRAVAPYETNARFRRSVLLSRHRGAEGA